MIDNEPPPAPSLRELIEALEPSQSIFLNGAQIGSVRTIVSRVKGLHEGRRYKTAEREGGSRVWRLA